MLERHFTAERANRIINDPSILPFLGGVHPEKIDLTPFSQNENNVFLIGEYGFVFFVKHQLGIYEFHTCVLPEGRGQWMVDGSQYAFNWMFTRTDAYELMTQCPQGNIPAKAGARAVGCSHLFTTRPVWLLGGKLVPVDIYSVLVHHWVKNAHALVGVGKEFHEELERQYKFKGKSVDIHEEDDVHNRYVGAAVEMIRHGQVEKAVAFYNRWAIMARYEPIKVLSFNPLVVDIRDSRLRVENNTFEVM